MNDESSRSKFTPGQLTVGIILAVLAAWVVIPVYLTMSRISRNTPLAKQLAAEIQVEFPTAEIQGGTGYSRDYVVISVNKGFETIDRETLKNRLREKKLEKKFSAEIWLRFPDDTGQSPWPMEP